MTHVKNLEGLCEYVIQFKLKELLKNVKYIFGSHHSSMGWGGDHRVTKIIPISEDNTILPPPASSK